MTHGLRMHKLFSKSHYDAAKQIQPFWLKASNVPELDEVTIITTATADTWDELVSLTGYWQGKKRNFLTFLVFIFFFWKYTTHHIFF